MEISNLRTATTPNPPLRSRNELAHHSRKQFERAHKWNRTRFKVSVPVASDASIEETEVTLQFNIEYWVEGEMGKRSSLQWRDVLIRHTGESKRDSGPTLESEVGQSDDRSSEN